ncbi:MAG: sugar ABC transporter permease [Clostridia bacterium]|nr:sugar ABC transporter permease [Clostridia bacterium]MBR4359420.1 sugar ABC transporter permease [Clostridia bacterium]
MAEAANKKTAPRGLRLVAGFQKHWRLHILALPVLIYMLLFSYAPMFGVVLAFEKYTVTRGFFGSEWVGLRNFEFLFATTDAWRITRNTVLYNIAFILLNTTLSVLLALVLNEMYLRRLSKSIQTLLIMPYFLSMSVVAIIVYAFIGPTGVVNSLIKASGQRAMTNWYTYKPLWPFLLVFVNAWKGVGYTAIVYVASISGISQEYYEAAVLDGASKLQQARYVTLPHLRHIIVIMLILSMGGMFRGDMGLSYNVTQNSGALYEVTDVIDTYVYRALKTLGNTGMSTAAGLYQSLVGFVLILISNRVVKHVDEESALF